MTKRKGLRSGSKIEALYNYLKKEIVGEELVFTVTTAKQVMVETEMKSARQVFIAIDDLVRKGLLSYRKLEHGKGKAISFPKESSDQPEREPRPKRKSLRKKRVQVQSDTMSLDQLIEVVNAEVIELESRLESRRKTHESLVTARAELKRR